MSLGLVLGEDVELAGDHVGETGGGRIKSISSYTQRCAVRRRVPGQLVARAARAGAGLLERVAVAEQLRDRGRERGDVARRNDAAGAEAAHRLGDAADVVRDRRHAGAERAEQRAALVELRPVREHGHRRLAEGAVDLGLRQVAEPPVDVEPGRRGAVRLHRLQRVARDEQPRVARRAARPRSRRRVPCTGGSRRSRAPSARRPRALRVAREDGMGDDAQPRRIVEQQRERVPAVQAVHDPPTESGRGAAATQLGRLAVHHGGGRCAVKTLGRCGRSSRSSSSGAASHWRCSTSARRRRSAASPIGCSATFSGTRSRERPRNSRDDSG